MKDGESEVAVFLPRPKSISGLSIKNDANFSLNLQPYLPTTNFGNSSRKAEGTKCGIACHESPGLTADIKKDSEIDLDPAYGQKVRAGAVRQKRVL